MRILNNKLKDFHFRNITFLGHPLKKYSLNDWRSVFSKKIFWKSLVKNIEMHFESPKSQHCVPYKIYRYVILYLVFRRAMTKWRHSFKEVILYKRFNINAVKINQLIWYFCFIIPPTMFDSLVRQGYVSLPVCLSVRSLSQWLVKPVWTFVCRVSVANLNC